MTKTFTRNVIWNGVLMALAAMTMISIALVMQARADEKPAPITIGIKAEHKFAGCRVADDAVQVAKLHVAQGYATAVTQFSRLSEEEHCAVLDGVWFPHRVVWHGDLQESTLKVVEMSPVGPYGNANFSLKFYVLTEREVVGSGIKEKVAGIES